MSDPGCCGDCFRLGKNVPNIIVLIGCLLSCVVACRKQALLLTGTGVTNQAALHAFGLNAEEAKRHLREAVASGEEGTAIPAAEALKWCEMEVRLSLDLLASPAHASLTEKS